MFHSSILNHPEILHFTREKIKTLSMAWKVVADAVMCGPGPLQNDLSLGSWKCSWQMALSCQCLQGLPQLKRVTSPKVTEPSRAASDWMRRRRLWEDKGPISDNSERPLRAQHSTWGSAEAVVVSALQSNLYFCPTLLRSWSQQHSLINDPHTKFYFRVHFQKT